MNAEVNAEVNVHTKKWEPKKNVECGSASLAVISHRDINEFTYVNSPYELKYTSNLILLLLNIPLNR